MAMSRRPSGKITIGVVAALLTARLAMAGAGSAQPAESQSSAWQRGVLDRYCVTCHNDRVQAGDLVLADLDVLSVHEAPATWETVVRKLRAGAMPPPARPRPDAETYDRLVSWLETELDRGAAVSPNPGRTESFHRLNRTEYHNVVRDLLDVEVDVTELLPVLTLAQQWDLTADEVARNIFAHPTLGESVKEAIHGIAGHMINL